MDENRRRNNNATILAFIILGIIVMSCGVVYFLINYDNTSKNNQSLLLNNCLNEAEKKYYDQWDYSCELEGQARDTCRMPNEQVDRWESTRRTDKEVCLAQYK